MTSEQSLLTLKKIKRLSRTLKAFTEGCPECLRVCIYIYIMLAAMTHPSRVLNLDMKAKLCMPKSYI